jgi:nucleotide-binding universal stress UspA family protein
MYHKIVAPLDGSELAEQILPHLASVALGCLAGTVELVRVIEPVNVATRGSIAFSEAQLKQINDETRKEAESYLDKIRQTLTARGLTVNTRVLSGRVAECLTDYIRESGADLLIISTHGRSGASRWLWGSVTEKLLHSICIPVMVVRPPSSTR